MLHSQVREVKMRTDGDAFQACMAFMGAAMLLRPPVLDGLTQLPDYQG